MKFILWLPFIIQMIEASYIGLVILDAWTEVQSAPREEMFICDKHGPIRKKHVMTLIDLPVCPLCFHENLKVVEAQNVAGM